MAEIFIILVHAILLAWQEFVSYSIFYFLFILFLSVVNQLLDFLCSYVSFLENMKNILIILFYCNSFLFKPLSIILINRDFNPFLNVIRFWFWYDPSMAWVCTTSGRNTVNLLITRCSLFGLYCNFVVFN